MQTPKYAIVGSTGLVGLELQTLFRKHGLAPDQVRTLGRQDPPVFFPHERVFLCTPATQALILAPCAIQQGATVIDLSRAHRDHPEVPLVIPEINGHLLDSSPPLIASPNCTATLLLMAIAPLHRHWGVESIHASTYQAASGAGKQGLEELYGKSIPNLFPHTYPNNIFLHESQRSTDGYCQEEERVITESHKILGTDQIAIHVRCVRVPTERTHAISASVTLKSAPTLTELLSVLRNAPGMALQDGLSAKCAAHKETVFVGNVRQSRFNLNTFDLWILGDQLLKGAALNALQIATQTLQTSVATFQC